MSDNNITINELNVYLEKHPETRFIELLSTDVNGILRGKRAPIDDALKVFKNGVNYCAATVMLNCKGATYSSIPMGSADGDPDVKAHMVAGTLVEVPWAAIPSAQAMVELTEFDGSPFSLDPRQVLRRSLQPLKDMGLHPVMAAELEFYLVEHDGTTFQPRMPRIPGSKLPQDGLQYSMLEDLEDVNDFLTDLDSICRIQNIPAGAALSEFAPGQFEVNLQHVDDPLRACEHAIALKRAVKAAARKNGLAATFMAKPFAEYPGSGLHIHVSLLDDDGNNVFAGECSDGNFSEVLRHAIGGLGEVMAESVALLAPNANSYRRYVPGSYVPCTPNWGVNHREVAMRIPLSSDLNSRVELRVAGADSNPYLVTAALMAGLHHGISNQCMPAKMVKEREQLEEVITLPTNWPLALEVFRKGSILPRYMGEEFCDLFATCRLEECHQFQAEVSNRDYEWYLRAV
jgi:glutamine synthetase